MNSTDIQARVLFAKTCVRGANEFASRGEHLLAAELRETAERYIYEATASLAKYRAPSPSQEKVRAYALTLRQILGTVH
jgi:hypothetical protein